jgi:hypothetical protein
MNSMVNPDSNDLLNGAIMIRLSRPSDAQALRRLAALECRRLPEGSFLLAEVDGELVAAAPIDADAEPLGDPFLPTADVLEFLGLRARNIRRRYAAEIKMPRRPELLPEPA